VRHGGLFLIVVGHNDIFRQKKASNNRRLLIESFFENG